MSTPPPSRRRHPLPPRKPAQRPSWMSWAVLGILLVTLGMLMAQRATDWLNPAPAGEVRSHG